MSDDRASFIVAVAAAVLAAAAFIVVALQAILEYLNSGSRHKCTFAAIGYTSKQVKVRWAPTKWRLRVHYPLLSFDWVDIMGVVQQGSVNKDIQAHKTMEELAKAHDDWFWSSVNVSDKLTKYHVADDLTVLRGWFSEPIYGGERSLPEPITMKHLNFKERLNFLSYRFRHNLRPLERPRASWAQLLVALGIRDTDELRLRMVDADTVPSALDAPIQRIKLSNLGYLAHILGFTKVSINITERHFLALCPLGTISTIEVSTLGKVLRFEGDIMAIHNLVRRTTPIEIYRAAYLINGKVAFGKYLANGLYLPLETLAQAISQKWSQPKWNSEMRRAILKDSREFFTGPIAREARIMNTIRKRWPKSVTTIDDSQEHSIIREEYGGEKSSELSRSQKMWTKKWQLVTKLTMPTIYIAATFLSFHSVICGFPSTVLIHSFLPWVASRARKLHERNEKPFKRSLALTDAMAGDTLKFARPRSAYLMSTGGGTFAGLFGWGIMNMKEVFEQCPPQIQNEIVPDLQSLDSQAVLTVETCNLLKRFDPQGWAESVKNSQREKVTDFNPINILWIQINLLDVAIQIVIRGDWSYGVAAETARGSTRGSQTGNSQPVPKTETTTNTEEVRNAELQITTNVTGGPSSIDPVLASDVQPTTVDPSEIILPATTSSVPRVNSDPAALLPRRTGSEVPMTQLERQPTIITEDPADDQAPDNKIFSESHEAMEARVISAIVKSWRPQRPEAAAAAAPTANPTEPTVHDIADDDGDDDDGDDDEDDEHDHLNAGDGGTSQPQEWLLVEALRAHSGLTFGTDDEAARAAKFAKLADLLELRALFVIALLVLHPDSSDTYSIEGEDIEMPMA